MRIGRVVQSVDLSVPSRASPISRDAVSSAGTGLSRQLGPGGLPAEIGFLSAYGIAPAKLLAACRLASRQGVSADQALLASGAVDERFFYQCLARHLGVSFIEAPVRLLDVAAETYPQAIHAEMAPFIGPDERVWLVAPRGLRLATLLRRVRRGGTLRSRLAITTPSHLSQSVRETARRKIAADASFELLSVEPDFSARIGSNHFQHLFLLVVVFIFLSSFLFSGPAALNVWKMVIGLLFLSAILFRLSISVSALDMPRPRRARLEDHQLPIYTVLVALHKEARVAERLIAMLDRIDYPRAKLEIKLLLEEDDDETRRALEALPLAPVYEIITVPDGKPRTKPRALNAALPLAKGSLLAVFDAEDAPDPLQLRRAAEQFAAAPSQVGCLQGKLAIENAEASWLSQLFAIEYAALFELQNDGLADLGLPFPVSGSSNHFRTSVLREVHGWDAWNVTEDADIGFRMARCGYRVDVLDSKTYEEAPVSLKAWMGQRRRWYKGWLQTFITVTRSPLRLCGELGPVHSAALLLLFVAQLFGPLVWIPTSLFLIYDIVGSEFWTPVAFSALCLKTVWVCVVLLGMGSLFWHALCGMKRRRLLHLWPVLLLLLPYYGLHTVAAWMAVYELFRHPFHWQKTEHGIAPKPRRPGVRAADGLLS